MLELENHFQGEKGESKREGKEGETEGRNKFQIYKEDDLTYTYIAKSPNLYN